MKTIFVSSTFKDMHFERDAIQEIALPALRTEAMKYGESVSFCDLRWGINTGDLDSEEGSRKVLDVCLDEIDRCKPPMVVILGDRYGWIPSEELTTSAADRKNLDKVQLKRDMELEDLQISVTALEIAYGALSTPEKRSQALFYFRHIESECPDDYAVEDSEHKKKLDHLKAKIESLTGGRIKHYYVRWDGEKLDGVIPFAEMLAEDIARILLPEWKQKELLTPFERERLTHWSFITEKNEMFSARSTLVQKYYDDLTQNGKHFLAIKAPSGSGKSMLFSNLALKLRDGGYDVVPFMSGLTSESNDSIDILCNTIYYIEDLLGFSHESIDFSFNGIEGSIEPNGEEPKEKKNGIEKLRERLFELCVECEQAKKRVIIMVDAVDQLASDDNRDHLIFIPERLSENVKFVMTCLPELVVPGYECVTINPMDDSEKRLVISGILDAHHRQIEDSVVDRMLTLEASSNPLFLSLLIQRLLMMNREDFFAINAMQMDAMKAISERQMEVLQNCPDSLQDMSAALLTEAGSRINKKLVQRVAEYLAVSRHGLRREDLAALIGDEWSELDFTHFITYMNESFMRRDDGRFDFSHKCIREGVLARCFDDKQAHQQLLTHLKQLPCQDLLKIQETVFHCLKADDAKSFVQFVLEYKDHIHQNKYAMKDLYSFSMLDKGEWIMRVLTDIADVTMVAVNEFVSFTFNQYGNYSQISVSKIILKKNIECIMNMKSSKDNACFHLAISLAYFSFAELCTKMEDGNLWEDRYEAYTKSIGSLNDAKALDNSIDIRFALSQRFESVGHLYREYEEKRNEALDYYKRAIKIREDLFAENASEQHRIALSKAYLSAGKVYALFTHNKDYLWRAISYFDQANSLIGVAHGDSAFFEQLADICLSIARVYCKEDAHDKNMQTAYDYYNKAITYYEKLLWKSSPEYVWKALINGYYEKATLLIRIVERIDEENNKIVKSLQGFPFDSTKRNDYANESVNSSRNVLYYKDKLSAVDCLNAELGIISVKALYMLSGTTVLLPYRNQKVSEDYLFKGNEAVYMLKDTVTDTELFLFYYEIYSLFANMSIKNNELCTLLNECLNRLNELLPIVKNNNDCDKEAIMFVEMMLCGYSKQYGKMVSYIPKLLIGALKEGFSLKKKKLKSKVRNEADRKIRRKSKSNIFAQQDKASTSLIFGVVSILGNCIVLPCKYLLRFLTPILLKISGNTKSLVGFILWYDNFCIFASFILLGCGLFACFSAIRSKKAALRTAIIGLILSIASSLIVLLSLNGSNYFEKQYNNAVALMDVGKYEEAIEVFELLYDYEDSVIKIEECNTAILDKKYNYAISMMGEDNIIEAYEGLIELNGYKDSAEIAKSIYDRYKNELLQSAQIGDCVYFGVYEQDNVKENGKENIEWIVLDKSDDKLFVISKYVLDCQVYNATSEDVTWEASTLRYWINTDFVNAAFSNDEIAMIANTAVSADDNPRYNVNQGSITQDKLFILSTEEAKQYFDSNDMRKCQATNYAKSSGATNAGCAWWLRTIGKYQNYASHIWQIGGVNDSGSCVNESDIGVRPAMWIELSK